jgi:GT2 family glycosyltransferase
MSVRTDSCVASVLIPTKKRLDLLRRAIASAFAQSVRVEVIVLDDGSADDGTEAMVRTEFPQAQYFRSDVSCGPTWQRNRGAGLARAPHLVTLDDDCELVDPETLRQTLAGFDHPRVAGVTIPFVNIHQDTVVRTLSPGPGVHATLSFFGGMVAFRRDLYLAVGGYRPAYFMQGEEGDLGLRLLQAGYVIRLGDAAPLHHHESRIRDTRRLHVLGARNSVLFSWFNVPQPYLLPHLVATTLKTAAFGLRAEHPRHVYEGIARGLGGAARFWAARAPVSTSVYRVGRRLKRAGATPLDQIEPFLSPLPPRHP